MTAAVRAQLLAAGAKLPTEKPAERTNAIPAPTEPQTRPAPLLSAQNTAAAGLAGVQVWKGVEGQGSVLRFFNLLPAHREALLAFAAELGIHPVRR